MSIASKTTVAVFEDGQRKTRTSPIWQYAQGQKLRFSGVELPESYHVDFSNEKDRSYSKPQVGDASGVTIPDEYLLAGKPVYAFVVLSEGADDCATELMAEIPVIRRPKPTDYAPTPEEQSVIDQVIAALSIAVQEAQAAEQAIENLGVSAETLQPGQQVTVEKVVDPETGEVTLIFSIPQGAKGDTGATGNGIASCVLNPDYTLTINYSNGTSTTTSSIRGAQGQKGDTGNGIKSIVLQSTSGLDKTYRITMTDNTYFDFTVHDGKGISSISKTSTSGLVDTYTITFTDGSTTTFSVTNGRGISSCVLNNNYTLTINYNDGTSTTTTSIRGAKGETGATPNISIGTVTTGAAGSSASATMTGTPENPVLNLVIPRGNTGEVSEAQLTEALTPKADKVTGGTAGDVAALDANGNVVDNGNKYQPVAKDGTMVLRVGVDSAGRLWASGDSGSERFGVQGVGNSSTTLTRLWDAEGLTATPGTDETAAQSDFDQFPVFNRRKCVGSWSVVDGKAVFTVQAYEGDADYAEDGTMGDYVAVDVPAIYWFHDEENKILGVSGNAHPGWEPHPVCLDANGDVREHTFLPVYPLAKDANGHAVSLPGFDPFFGCYKDVWDAARTYGDGSLSNYAIIEPSVVDHYEWLMQTIEFATTSMQTVMAGATSMAYNTNHTITAAPEANKIVLTAAIGNEFVVGQTIYIGAGHGETPTGVDKYNHITAIEKCDASGTPDDAGTYRLVTYDGTDRTSSITANTTKVASRPWINGATNGAAPGVSAVLGHTGSPVSNSSAKYPMRYRWRENVYGNINITALDLFNARTADGTSYHLDWYYNDRLRYEGPTLYYPSSTSKPDLTDLQNTTKGFRKLSTTTPVDSYKDGYIKEEGFDADLPCIRVPTLTSGGSATTYYADYAYLVYSIAVRSVRRRGSVHYGAFSGPRSVAASYAPSYASWYYGAALYLLQ